MTERQGDRTSSGRHRRQVPTAHPSPERHNVERHSLEQSHGHGHNHGPAAPASARVRHLLIALLIPVALATVVGAGLLYPWGSSGTVSTVGANQTAVHGTVTVVAISDCTTSQSSSQSSTSQQNDNGPKQCASVTVKLTDGPGAGQSITEPSPLEPATPHFSVGDNVVLSYEGGNITDPGSYQLVDFQRGTPLIVLAVLFIIAVLVLGRWQGLAALGALGLTFAVLVFFILPAILAGKDPLSVAITGSGLIIFAVLYLTHGLSARTSTAVLGTLLSLGLIGLLGWLFTLFTQLTGLSEDTANLIGLLGHGIDSRGLLLAGVVIGAIGVLDDVTVTQTSAVWELRRANPALSWRALYAAGLRIGRDHMSSAVNTLVLAYAGAGLPLLLAYSASGHALGDVLTAETVAQELVRTLVGSIGLVASIPITTLLAALVASQERRSDELDTTIPQRRVSI